MKICVLISSLDYGGSSQVAVDLSCGLTQKGHNVTLISLWGIKANKYVECLKARGVDIQTCSKKNAFDFLCYKRLKKIFKKEKFDIINTHLTSLFYCYLAKPAQTVVHTIHSIPNLDIPKTYRLLMKRWIKKHKVIFVGCSNSIFLEGQKCYKGHRIELITNGYDCKADRSKPIENKEYDFVYAGRLVKMKNINELLLAFKRYCSNKKICIVGDGPERPQLESLCKNENINNVSFVGFIDDVNAYLAKSRVFCLFSDFEGGPICLLEAMNYGLPVVCSNIEGNKTYTINGVNGLLFELHNIDDAGKKMSLILNNKDLYSKLSKGSLKTAKDNIVDSMVNKYESLFMRLKNGN